MEVYLLGHEKFVLSLSAEVGNDAEERIEELRRVGRITLGLLEW
jgi:hypothetical protein